MTAAGFDDSWCEFFLVGITKKGGSEVQFGGTISEITDFTWMEKDIEGIKNAKGGRIVKKMSTDIESITFKVYDVSADLDGTGFIQLFQPQTSEDITDPIAIVNTNSRNRYQIVLTWATTLPATAGAASATDAASYRITIKNAYLTQYKPSFDDKIKSAEVTFKWVPLDKDASSNKTEESTDGSVALSAVSAYA